MKARKWKEMASFKAWAIVAKDGIIGDELRGGFEIKRERPVIMPYDRNIWRITRVEIRELRKRGRGE